MKSLTAGSEIDSWCTKCRMDLGHRIVAMVGGKPKRVVCQTCDSEHNYRAPRQVSSSRAGSPAKKATAKSASARGPQESSTRVTNAVRHEAERLQDWQDRVNGQTPTAFTRYKTTVRFAVDELVLHPKFGEGYVVEVKDGDKVNVMFRDQARVLAHGLS